MKRRINQSNAYGKEMEYIKQWTGQETENSDARGRRRHGEVEAIYQERDGPKEPLYQLRDGHTKAMKFGEETDLGWKFRVGQYQFMAMRRVS